MTNTTNFAFNSLNHDEFHNTVRHSECDHTNIVSSSYEDYIANKYNTLAQEFQYNFDSNDPVQSPSCVYLTENQYKNRITNTVDENFLLAHFNIRSINRNFDKLRLLLENPNQKSCSVIGLTETWLNSNISHLFSLPGFEFVYRNRHKRVGGGVGLYISKKLKHIIQEEISITSDVVESLFIELMNPHGKNILIGVIYRPPRSNFNDFLTSLQDLVQNPNILNKDVFLMGDFNIDLMKCNSQNNSQEFIETLMSASFLPLISKPTRVASQSATLIDNIFCNVLPLPESGIVLSDITDHYPIFAQVPIKLTKQNNFYRRRKITTDNLTSLQNSLKEIDWSFVYNTTDVNLSYDKFIATITSKIDNHIPMRNIKNRYKRIPKLPWITQSILRSINRKNNLFYKYRCNPTEKNKKKYVSYKNTLTKLLRTQKKNFYVNQISKYKNDIKNTWKTIKNAMNTPNNTSNISEIRWGNASSNTPAGMAEIFNDFFSSIGKNLSQNIPSSCKSFRDFLGTPNSKTIFFDPTYAEEITKIVANLKEGKSPGHDGIDNYLIKNIFPQIVDPLVHIINSSLTTGHVPNSMKIAKVIPIYKKGEKDDVNNYRPISLLTFISKILERIVYIRTERFLKTCDIFSKFQFGFRENHSTTHALLTLIDKVTHALDTFSHTIGIFLDFSKAFDTINHQILLAKLAHYGIRGKALEWFTSYLSNRSQFVHVNGFNSQKKTITCGVPQGSLLGPLLFIIYINDFHRSSEKLSFILFADDSKFFLFPS